MAGTGAPRAVVFIALFAALVTAAALIAVAMMRPRAETVSAAEPAPPSPTASDCGQGPCEVLSTQDVQGTTIELLADAKGGTGRFRVGGAGSNVVIETVITSMGVRLNHDSMRCVTATVSACLVRGSLEDGMLGEVLVARGDNWRAAEKPYLSDADGIVLDNVTGDDSAEVIVVKHDCAGAPAAKCQVTPVYAEVFDLTGRQTGCTRKYTSPSQIRGWPDIKLTQNDLRACP